MRQQKRALALFAAFVAALLIAAWTPHADTGTRHLRLLRSEPAADSVLQAAPTAIQLWFSEAPQLRVTTIRVATPEMPLQAVKPTQDAADGKHISADLTTPPTPGTYRVVWRTMSRDGHVVNGEFSFTYRP